MGSYKLSDEAEADLIRIHQWGVRQRGEEQADRYFAAFFDHFKRLAEQPLLYSVTDIREGYRRSVCGSDSVEQQNMPDSAESKGGEGSAPQYTCGTPNLLCTKRGGFWWIVFSRNKAASGYLRFSFYGLAAPRRYIPFQLSS